MNTKEEIKAFTPTKDFFIGIDSDGSVFDAMNIKHKNSMCPAVMEIWGMGEHKKKFEEIWYKYNLYSGYRGTNRFISLLMSFIEIQKIDSELPVKDINPLREFVNNNEILSEDTLKAWMLKNPSAFLDDVIRWSNRSDELFNEYTKGLLPFVNAEHAIKIMAEKADIMVVSSATGKGLDKDWSFSGLTKYTGLIAGQEAGSKKMQLKMATEKKYSSHKILMIGDAPGDLKAAQAVSVLYYPIIPGNEDESWRRFHDEALEKFFNMSFEGAYQDSLIAEFNKSLPEKAPWQG